MKTRVAFQAQNCKISLPSTFHWPTKVMQQTNLNSPKKRISVTTSLLEKCNRGRRCDVAVQYVRYASLWSWSSWLCSHGSVPYCSCLLFLLGDSTGGSTQAGVRIVFPLQALPRSRQSWICNWCLASKLLHMSSLHLPSLCFSISVFNFEINKNNNRNLNSTNSIFSSLNLSLKFRQSCHSYDIVKFQNKTEKNETNVASLSHYCPFHVLFL